VENLQNIGLLWIASLQNLSPALDGVMYFFTFLGKVEFYLVFIPLIYWLADPRLGFRLLLLVNLTDMVTGCFKQLFHQPRPYWIGGVKEMASEISYGIPSTHASGPVAFWGFLAYWVKKRWLTALVIVVVLLIGVSRMYLAVHFPHDVLAGWLLGLALLALFIWGERRFSPRLSRASTGGQIGLGFGVSIVMILIGLAVRAAIAPYPDPESWAHFAVAARSLTYYFTQAGIFFGAVTGYACMRRWAHFRPGSGWWRLILCYLLGVASLLVLYAGLDYIFSLLAADESTLGYLLRYIRYAAINIWAIFIVPWIFLKLRLARPAEG
jgi:membrane-associated phospholipid phosphatase